MPIQITITGENATETKALVHDLAGTMSKMNNADIPENTEVSTVDPTNDAQPTQQPVAQPTQPTQPSQPATAVPTTQPQNQNPGTSPFQTGYQPATTVPTSETSYTLDQLGVACGPLIDSGKSDDLLGWIKQRGANSLTELNPAYYGEFATFIRGLGAQI